MRVNIFKVVFALLCLNLVCWSGLGVVLVQTSEPQPVGAAVVMAEISTNTAEPTVTPKDTHTPFPSLSPTPT